MKRNTNWRTLVMSSAAALVLGMGIITPANCDNPADGIEWIQNADKLFCYENGLQQTGWKKNDGGWCWLTEDGSRITGWIRDKGTCYYLKNGRMQTGWIQDGNHWYLLGQDGGMRTGWARSGSHWYYLDENGEMQTGWCRINNEWYCFDNSGAMKTGWHQDGTCWYYLKSSGEMARNCEVDGCHLGPDGAMTQNYQGNAYGHGNGAGNGHSATTASGLIGAYASSSLIHAYSPYDTYAVNTESGCIHKQSCYHVKQLKVSHKGSSSASLSALLGEKMKTCGWCFR